MGRILLMLYRNCTRRGSSARNRMAVDRLALSLLTLGSGTCFNCQRGEPGKELDLATWFGKYRRGVGAPGTEQKNERWRNQITHCNDHRTQWSPYPAVCRRLSQLLALDGDFGLLLFTDPAARCLTFRQKYLEEVEKRVYINKNGMYF